MNWDLEELEPFCGHTDGRRFRFAGPDGMEGDRPPFEADRPPHDEDLPFDGDRPPIEPHGERHRSSRDGRPPFDGDRPPIDEPPFPPRGEHPPVDEPPRGNRPPRPPRPNAPAVRDPNRMHEFPPFGEMVDYDTLSVDGRLTHRLRGLSHKLNVLSGSIGGRKRVMMILAACPGITQRQLMDLVRVRASSLSEVLGKLESAGQIRRQVCPFDRRMVQVYLTEAGEAAAKDLKDGGGTLYGCLTDEEKNLLLAALEKLDDDWAKRCPLHPNTAAAE